MRRVWRRQEEPRALEQPVPIDLQPEHRPAEQDRLAQRRPDDVLDDPGPRSVGQRRARGRDVIGILGALVSRPQRRVRLARRAGVDNVELPPVPPDELNRVAPVELVAGVAQLGGDVHADHVEAGQLVSARTASRATIGIQ
jgi:hypothetical protein